MFKSSRLKEILSRRLKKVYNLPFSSHFYIILSGSSPATRLFSRVYQELAQEKYAGFSFLNISNPANSSRPRNDFISAARDQDLVINCYDHRCYAIDHPGKKLFFVNHPHCRMINTETWPALLSSLDLDYEKSAALGHWFKSRLSRARSLELINSQGEVLKYNTGFKEIYDFSVSGNNLPTGEVFSEPLKLRAVSGRARVLAFAGHQGRLVVAENPFLIEIKNGFLIRHQGPSSFDSLLAYIKKENNNHPFLRHRFVIRELGFGTNLKASLNQGVPSSVYFEKIFGTAHISLGPSHQRFSDAWLDRQLPDPDGHYDLILDLHRFKINKKTFDFNSIPQ